MLLIRRTIDRAHAESGTRGVAATLNAVAGHTESQTDWLELAKIYKRLKSSKSRKPWEDFKSGLAILGTAAKESIRLHQYLSLLPTTEAPKAVLSALRLSMPVEFESIRPTMLLLPDLAYYEFDLSSAFQRDAIFSQLVLPSGYDRKVIRLSGPDSTAPMCWPIAFHEFAHAVSDQRGLADAAGFAITDDISKVSRRYYEEFFADALAARTVGFTGILALIRFESLLFTIGQAPVPSQTHPSVRSRIDATLSLVPPEVAAPFQPLVAEVRWLSEELFARTNPTPQALAGLSFVNNTLVPPAAAAAARDALALTVNEFHAESAVRSQRLAHRLARGLPPAAVRWIDKADSRPVLNAAIGKRDPDEFRSALSLLAERPASPGEVFTAGHLRREQDLPAIIDRVLESPYSAWDDWVRPIREFFDGDEFLVAAMHTIEIHEFLVEHARIAGDLPEPKLPPPPPQPTGAAAQGRGSNGGVLGDSEIAQRLVEEAQANRLYVTPLIDPVTQIGPASIDIRLGFDALVLTNTNFVSLDPIVDEAEALDIISRCSRLIEITPESPLVLHPGEFALAASLEYLRVPQDLACRLEGRSSHGRAGLLVHATAGFIDPGYDGRITLELTNLGEMPLSLYAGMRIGQLCFLGCSGTILGYSTKKERKYSGALKALATRIFRDREFKWYREARAKKP